MANPVGTVLGMRCGAKICPLLAARHERTRSSAVLLALGATRLPQALPILSRHLENSQEAFPAARALVLHRSRDACRTLGRALQGCDPHDMKRAETYLKALAAIPKREALSILRETARGLRTPAFWKVATRLLGKRGRD